MNGEGSSKLVCLVKIVGNLELRIVVDNDFRVIAADVQ